MKQKVHQCLRFLFLESVEITMDVHENLNRERAMYVMYMLSYASQPGSPSWLQYAVLDTLFDEVHEDP
jgi:hypothetical protein